MEVIDIIKQCSADGNILRLPKIELSREDYLVVKKAIEKYGGKWKGGKTFGFVFADRDAADVIDSMVNGSADIKKDFQFFATPSDVADLMVAKLEIQPYEKILEPSAGNGALINAVRRLYNDITVDCYELNPLNRKVLEKMANVNVLGDDFTKHLDNEEYDVIIANPPFSKNQDIIHLMKMWDNLRYGGRIACITSTHWMFSNDKKSTEFRDWILGKYTFQHEFPNGTFKESGTDIATILLILEK